MCILTIQFSDKTTTRICDGWLGIPDIRLDIMYESKIINQEESILPCDCNYCKNMGQKV